MKKNLLGLNFTQLADYFKTLEEKPFRARQLMHWIYQAGETDFEQMSDIAKSLRKNLQGLTRLTAPSIIKEQHSADGTIKWLLDVGTGNGIETVFIPEQNRGTLCVSSQVGCALNCGFCSTGKQGFNRNLDSAEIIGQLWRANQILGAIPKNTRIISNVVMMGMGEPLANFENVVSSLEIMLDDCAYGLSRRRVTVSTSGMVPQLDLLRERCPVSLAVSLHAPNDSIRDRLIPLNKKYPLKDLIAACRRYLHASPRNFITFEYIMLKDINDRAEHAYALVNLVSDLPCKFNLIPLNSFNNVGFLPSAPEVVNHFRDILSESGIVTTIRKKRGDDVYAACGQLAGEVKDKTLRTHCRSSRSSGIEEAL